MKRFSEQFQKKANSLKMRADEKRELKERLLSYMEYHPLPKEAIVKKAKSDKESKTLITGETVYHLNIGKFRLWQWSGVFVATIFLVVPYVAERAVPGDMLYAVKINFNEEIRSSLAGNSYEKVVWETERLNRRIAEARLLADEGKMTDEIEESVALAVRVHSENARNEIKHLKETDEGEATLASIQLNATIDIQTASFRSVSKASSTDKESTNKIANALALESKEVDEEEIAIVFPSKERLLAQVERETTRAYEFLSSVKTLATEEEKSDIKRRLEDIDRKTKIALEKFEFDEKEAQAQMLNILQSTQKLIVFMTNIDVRESITVDEIVPVTLTDEERLNIVKEKRAEVSGIIIKINEALDQGVLEAEVVGKVEKVMIEAELVVKDIDVILSKDDFSINEVESKIDSVYDSVVDSAKLVGLTEFKQDNDKNEEVDKSNDETSATTTDEGTEDFDEDISVPTSTATGTKEISTTTSTNTDSQAVLNVDNQALSEATDKTNKLLQNL